MTKSNYQQLSEIERQGIALGLQQGIFRFPCYLQSLALPWPKRLPAHAQHALAAMIFEFFL